MIVLGEWSLEDVETLRSRIGDKYSWDGITRVVNRESVWDSLTRALTIGVFGKSDLTSAMKRDRRDPLEG
jgi:hypothetical protein